MLVASCFPIVTDPRVRGAVLSSQLTVGEACWGNWFTMPRNHNHFEISPGSCIFRIASIFHTSGHTPVVSTTCPSNLIDLCGNSLIEDEACCCNSIKNCRQTLVVLCFHFPEHKDVIDEANKSLQTTEELWYLFLKVFRCKYDSKREANKPKLLNGVIKVVKSVVSLTSSTCQNSEFTSSFENTVTPPI